jgi:tight adherence protein B
MSLLLGAVVFLIIAAGGALLAWRLAPPAPGAGAAAPSPPSARPAAAPRDPAPALGRLLHLTGFQSRLRWELVRAGVMLWPSELFALSAGVAALGWVLGRVGLHQDLLGLLLAGAGLAAPWLAVSTRRVQRLKRLTQQLPSALTMLASSLRSGYSLLRAFQVLAEELQPPISEEVRRVLDETNVGYSLDQALTNLVQRTQSADVKLVVTAVQIQSRVGGNLAEILDKTAALIRDRFQLSSEISALTAEGRMSTAVLVGLPIGLGVIINVLSPGYLSPLWTDPLGRMMLGAAAGMLGLGVLMIKKMLDVTI